MLNQTLNFTHAKKMKLACQRHCIPLLINFFVVENRVQELSSLKQGFFKSSLDCEARCQQAFSKLDSLKVVISYCLGIEIVQDIVAGTVKVSQRSYCHDIPSRFGMLNTYPYGSSHSTSTFGNFSYPLFNYRDIVLWCVKT